MQDERHGSAVGLAACVQGMSRESGVTEGFMCVRVCVCVCVCVSECYMCVCVCARARVHTHTHTHTHTHGAARVSYELLWRLRSCVSKGGWMSTSVNWRKRGIELTCVLRAWSHLLVSPNCVPLLCTYTLACSHASRSLADSPSPLAAASPEAVESRGRVAKATRSMRVNVSASMSSVRVLILINH
jgi:hypothetical protein